MIRIIMYQRGSSSQPGGSRRKAGPASSFSKIYIWPDYRGGATCSQGLIRCESGAATKAEAAVRI